MDMKQRNSICFCVSLVFFLGGLLPDASGTIFCDGALISVGDSMEKVREACGKPTTVQKVRDALINKGGIIVRLNVDEEWVYDSGSDQFKRIIRFRAGKVVDIETRDFGGQTDDDDKAKDAAGSDGW